jgi:hypothetical protein
MPLTPEQLAALDEPASNQAAATPDLLTTRSGKVLAYITAVNAAAGTVSMRARTLAQRLAVELGYPDPLNGKPAQAIEPALLEIERALDGAPVADAGGDAWG